MRDHFIQRLGDLVQQDPNILLITGDLGFGVFNDFRENYPDNFINAGVAEQQMTGLATGLAWKGRPHLPIPLLILPPYAVWNRFAMMQHTTAPM